MAQGKGVDEVQDTRGEDGPEQCVSHDKPMCSVQVPRWPENTQPSYNYSASAGSMIGHASS